MFRPRKWHTVCEGALENSMRGSFFGEHLIYPIRPNMFVAEVSSSTEDAMTRRFQICPFRTFTMAHDSDDDQYSPQETSRRMKRALQRALNMPPQPHGRNPREKPPLAKDRV